ncbi:MAG: dimethyl sulfoxide reductase anchor subunit family protein [Arenicella sp.]
MHPAPSVIIFTVLTGLGFGYIAWLGFGLPEVIASKAFFTYLIAFALSVGGLISSTFHLGNPKNAYKSFSQWRTSWLSREGWLAVITLMITGLFAFLLIFFEKKLAILGYISSLLAVLTVIATSMIYIQIKAVPRWNHRSVMFYFVSLSLAGGAILAGQNKAALILTIVAVLAQIVMWKIGDGRFAEEGSTMESATGLGFIGKVRLFEPPHTGDNYLLKEMAYVIGRKHANKLRLLALLFLGVIPIGLLMMPNQSIGVIVLAVASHLVGAFASRWLFFAEAEHVVGLYYGKR